jgi:DNA invertase Pin-like site-specific DNA recombinase
MNDLDQREWESRAVRLFGDSRIEWFDPSRNGCRYFAKNALAEHGEYRLGGKLLEGDNKVANAEGGIKNKPLRAGSRNGNEDLDATLPNHATLPGPVKRADVYIRIAEETPAEDLILHDRIQLRPLDRLIAERGWNRRTVHRDVANAKAGKSRCGLDALMAAARRGEVDVILVSRLDRIARNTAELVQILAELQDLGVDFVSLEDRFDTTTSRAVFIVVTALVEMEKRLRTERSEAGLENAKRHGTKTGNRIGRPRAVVDVARLLRYVHKGWSTRRISRKLGVSPATLDRRYLESRDAQ